MRHRIAVLAACTMVMSGAGVAAAATGPALAAPARGGAALTGDTGAAGVISTIAGGVGGPALGTAVAVRFPCGVAYGGGNLYAGDSTSVRRVSPQSGDLTTPAGTGGVGPRGDGGPAVRASLVGACGVAVDGSGNLLIADAGHQGIRVVAASTGTSYGQAMTARHIYTVAGDGQQGFSGDGGPATSAEFNGPGAVAVDGAGNLVLDDMGNERIRVVAEHTGTFYGQPMTAGDIYTVAGNGDRGFAGDGGPAASARLDLPAAVAVDAAGNVVLTDRFNQRVRVVAEETGTFYGVSMTAGDIYTVAGTGKPAFSGDGRLAVKAGLSQPAGVAVDGAGNLVIADTGNVRVRLVTG